MKVQKRKNALNKKQTRVLDWFNSEQFKWLLVCFSYHSLLKIGISSCPALFLLFSMQQDQIREGKEKLWLLFSKNNNCKNAQTYLSFFFSKLLRQRRRS